jgi:hypothetical protein
MYESILTQHTDDLNVTSKKKAKQPNLNLFLFSPQNSEAMNRELVN